MARAPRIAVVSVGSVTGHLTVAGDELRTLLVYSTDFSCSYGVGWIDSLSLDGQVLDAKARTTANACVAYQETNAGDSNPARGARRLAGS